MKTKSSNAYSRGGGSGRLRTKVQHPADPVLKDTIRAQHSIFEGARREVQVTLFEYIFLGRRTGRSFGRGFGGGGYSRGGGGGRLRVGFKTNKTPKAPPEKLFKGHSWREVQTFIASVMYYANKLAMAVANANAPSAMADGATYTAYQFRDDYYALPYTEQAVESLARENLLTVPSRAVDKAKDIAWTRRLLNTIAARYVRENADADKLPSLIASALVRRCQQTMDTSTQALIYGAFDAGMYQAGTDASDAGLPVEKTWLSIMDNRVRESHDHLHRTTLPLNRRFHGIYSTLRYPHDPQAHPAEIMRCRCRMAIHLQGKAPYAPEHLSRSAVAAYTRWRDSMIDALGGELALEAAHRRRLHGR